MSFFLPIFYSSVLAAVHFYNEKIQIRNEYIRTRALSFVAGISVTYGFLNLLPEVYKGFAFFDRFIFITLLLGFVVAHLTEQYVYQHTSVETVREKLGEIHSLAFFLYHFTIGVILVDLSRDNTLRAVLFFLPILFYSAVGLIALERIHPKIWESPAVKLLLSLSTLFGVLFADSLLRLETIFSLLLAFVVGLFLYIVLIDFIPKEAKGRPEYFALGVFTYTVLIAATFA